MLYCTECTGGKRMIVLPNAPLNFSMLFFSPSLVCSLALHLKGAVPLLSHPHSLPGALQPQRPLSLSLSQILLARFALLAFIHPFTPKALFQVLTSFLCQISLPFSAFLPPICCSIVTVSLLYYPSHLRLPSACVGREREVRDQ